MLLSAIRFRLLSVAGAALVFGWCMAAFTGCSSEDGVGSADAPQYQVADGSDAGDGAGPGASTDPVTLEAGSPTSSGSPTQQGDAAGSPNATATGGQSPQQPPSLPGATLNQYTVPDGTPEELIEFLKELSQRQPQGTNNEEMLADYANIHNAAIEAADKIIAADASPDIRATAVQAKLNSLRVLAEMGTPDVLPKIRAFCQELKQDDDVRLSRLGRLVLFGIQIGDLAGGNSEDTAALIRELEAMLGDKEWIATEGQGIQVFGVAQQAALVLQQLGKFDESSAAYTAIGNAFSDHPNPQVARNALGLLEQPALTKVDFDRKRDAALMDEPDSMEPFLAAARELLAKDKPGPLVLEKLLQAGHYMEITHHNEQAREIYTLVGKAYEAHEDEKLKEQAATYVGNGLRRADLIGKPFAVEGVLLDGTPFDWKKYQGKVVLVDFWASWCGPCIQELPNIERNYQLYRDKGFEVIGVNLDDDAAQRDEFLNNRKLMWPTVVSADPEAQGFDNPLAIRCGIDAIPFLVLINQQGEVVALHSRGEQLGEKLAELLGPVEGAEGGQPQPGGAGAAAGQDGNVQPANAELPLKDSSSMLPHTEAAWFVSFVDEPEGDDSEATEEDDPLATRNPYLAAADLSALELVDYLLDMEEKPSTIRRRPGFTGAVVEASDRVLSMETKEKYLTIAALVKFRVLHDAASFEEEGADKQLAEFVEKMKDDKRPKIEKEVRFLTLERRALGVDDLPREDVPALLKELQEYLKEQKLEERHLRIASAAVHAVNRLEEDAREEHFKEFGKLFAASRNRELARYGKKLSKPAGAGGSDLVGKPLELAGVTMLGDEFNWDAYRGKVVLVDFWATWCGPCRKAMPKVKALFNQFKDKSFDVVGVSLDQDLDALAEYVDENGIPWTNLSGEGVQDLAKKYSVRGIPTMMLVDRQGKILAVTHNVDQLTAQIENLVNDKG